MLKASSAVAFLFVLRRIAVLAFYFYVCNSMQEYI